MADPAGVTLPSGRPALLASDLDGTLLRGDGSISARTRAAIEAAEEAGIGVLFVTARPPRWLASVADAVGGHGTVIAGNGAWVYDVHDRRVTAERGFGRDQVLGLVARLRAALPDAGFAAERASGPHIEAAFHERHPESDPAGAVSGPIEGLSGETVGKLLATAPGLRDEELLERVSAVVGSRGVLAYSGAPGLAEISAPGVTKAAALARWCAEHGIPSDAVWAFGDMPNDLPMLRWAGASFAVANAHADVHSQATHRCPSNDQDGVAHVVEAVLAR
ncbi:MAG TPA: HAD-IIB family hydrolase [Dermatophilaceae bacterium]|jgi:HAD superfamily hydrolase (TIGR01484 family)|nr:HAD-IIB family hydrolase [Dermatophilaceae bacterium]HMT88853.1 HAD-IIB family hydrolase [Dermatophilaceae bacterium]